MYGRHERQVPTNILIFLFLLLLPTQLGRHFFLPFSYISGVRIDYLAPTLYVTDILALFLIAVYFKNVLRFFYRKTFLLFLLLAAINIAFALNSVLALYKFLKIIECIGIFVCIRSIGEHHDTPLRNILIPLTIGASGELILAVWQFISKHSIQGIFYFFGERYITLSQPDIAKVSLFGVEILRPYATFSHPNSLAGFYLLLYFFVLTNKQSQQSSPFILYTKYLLLFLSSALIFLSFSKIAILLFLLLNTLCLIRSKFYQHCLLCFVGRLGVLIVLTATVLLAKGDALSMSKRIDLMGNSINIFLQHPLLGVGLGNYLNAQQLFVMKYPYFFLQPVHNIFLLLLSEGGLLLTGFLTYVGIKLLTNQKTIPYCLLVVVITGLFDHYWLTLQQNILLLPVIFGLLARYKTSFLIK